MVFMLRGSRMRLFLTIALFLTAGSAWAGPTERACLRSERSPGAQACACAQSIADQTLSARDQRQAARIIADPDRLQKFTSNKRQSSQAFVKRYRYWGQMTAKYCS